MFERAFLMRPDDFVVLHEPMGEAWYYGPQRSSPRFKPEDTPEQTEQYKRQTYAQAWQDVLNPAEAAAGSGKRCFSKDMVCLRAGIRILTHVGSVHHAAGQRIRQHATSARSIDVKSDVSAQSGSTASGRTALLPHQNTREGSAELSQALRRRRRRTHGLPLLRSTRDGREGVEDPIRLDSEGEWDAAIDYRLGGSSEQPRIDHGALLRAHRLRIRSVHAQLARWSDRPL